MTKRSSCQQARFSTNTTSTHHDRMTSETKMKWTERSLVVISSNEQERRRAAAVWRKWLDLLSMAVPEVTLPLHRGNDRKSLDLCATLRRSPWNRENDSHGSRQAEPLPPRCVWEAELILFPHPGIALIFFDAVISQIYRQSTTGLISLLKNLPLYSSFSWELPIQAWYSHATSLSLVWCVSLEGWSRQLIALFWTTHGLCLLPFSICDKRDF